MSKYDKDNYESCRFKSSGMTRYGYMVGKYLCIAYSSQGRYDSYKVFVVSTGKALTGKIADFDTAVELAKAYNWLYRDQIFLHADEEWANRNLPELCQYTIPHGHFWSRFWNRLAEIEDQISMDTLKRIAQNGR